MSYRVVQVCFLQLAQGPSTLHTDVLSISLLSQYLQDPDLLIRIFVFLAFASESDLGFDTEIERVNNSDFQLRFSIQGENYLTLMVLYDIRADSMCGRGTWVFEAYLEDHKNLEPYAIKDCWVEDRPGKQMEHAIIEQVREVIGRQAFCEHFVDFRGYRKVTNEAITKYCGITLCSETPSWSKIYPLVLEAKVDHATTYTKSGQAVVIDPEFRLEPGASSAAHQRHPHPRFRYQIVYAERGVSLYDITSLSKLFGHLIEVTKGMIFGAIVLLPNLTRTFRPPVAS
jgi:Fungal protein kinase